MDPKLSCGLLYLSFALLIRGSIPAPKKKKKKKNHATGRMLCRWRAGVWGRNRSSALDRVARTPFSGAGTRQSNLVQSLSHSGVLSHAWCQACVELGLLGREGSLVG